MKSATQESQQHLSNALAAMVHWRNHKANASDPIPDEIWSQIFALENAFPVPQLRSLFNLSTKQYAGKRMKLIEAAMKPASSSLSQSEPAEQTEFCKVTLKPEATMEKAAAIPKAKLSAPAPSPYALEALPHAKTLIVEFCRQDGAIMKIHTTQDSIAIVMQNFFDGAA